MSNHSVYPPSENNTYFCSLYFPEIFLVRLTRVSYTFLSIFSFLNLHSPETKLLSTSEIAMTSISADCTVFSPFEFSITSVPHQFPAFVMKLPNLPCTPCSSVKYLHISSNTLPINECSCGLTIFS